MLILLPDKGLCVSWSLTVIICTLNLILPQLNLNIISGLQENYMDFCTSVSNVRIEVGTWENELFPEKHHP